VTNGKKEEEKGGSTRGTVHVKDGDFPKAKNGTPLGFVHVTVDDKGQVNLDYGFVPMPRVEKLKVIGAITEALIKEQLSGN